MEERAPMSRLKERYILPGAELAHNAAQSFPSRYEARGRENASRLSRPCRLRKSFKRGGDRQEQPPLLIWNHREPVGFVEADRSLVLRVDNQRESANTQTVRANRCVRHESAAEALPLVRR